MSHEETYLLPPVAEGDRVYLVFHPAHSGLSRRQKRSFGRELQSESVERLPRNVTALRVTGQRPEREIDIETDGAPAQLVKYVLRRGDDLLEHSPSRDGVFVAPRAANRPFESLLAGTADYLTELWAALDAAPDTPLWKYRKFFADLDRHTDEALRKQYLATAQPGLLAAMDAAIPVVMAVLTDCLTRRANDPTHGYRRPEYPGAAVVQAELRAVSDLFLSLVFKHFRVPGRGLDLDSIEDAFEMFSNGELRVQLPSLAWACQPSSGMFFYFAEFATLCAAAGIEKDTWTAIANCMVRTQRVFCNVYRPTEPAPWNLLHYKAENYDAARTYTRLEKDILRRAFEGKSLDELTILHAAQIEEFAPDTVDEAMVSAPPVGLGQPAPAPPAPARLPSLIAP